MLNQHTAPTQEARPVIPGCVHIGSSHTWGLKIGPAVAYRDDVDHAEWPNALLKLTVPKE